MSITRINGVRLFWDLRGETGDLLVLVHGSWGNHHNWDSVVPALQHSFRVLTYDRRGHSQSERPGEQGHVEEDVVDLAALIDHIGRGPAHIAGNSFGAAIVLRLAGERPDVFLSLVAHEPPLFRLLEREPQGQAALSAITDRIGVVVRMLEAGDYPGGRGSLSRRSPLGLEPGSSFLPSCARRSSSTPQPGSMRCATRRRSQSTSIGCGRFPLRHC